MIVECTLQGHGVCSVFFDHKTQDLGNPKLEAVHLLQRYTKEPFKVLFVYLGAVCRPEQPINHSLSLGKANGQRSSKRPSVDPIAIGFNVKGIDLKLISQQGCCRTAKAQEIISRHRGIVRFRFAGECPDGATGVSLAHAIPCNAVQKLSLFLFRHRLYRACRKGEINKRIDSNMICTQGKGFVDVGLQIIVGLLWKGKDKVHGNCFKLHGIQCLFHSIGINGLSSQDALILVAEGLNTNADLGYTGSL